MAKHMRLTFTEEGVSVEAELLEGEAPRTCQAIWDGLPFEGEVGHAIYSGSEVFLYIPDEIVIEAENQTSRVLPGDVGYYHVPPGVVYGRLDGLSEICWFYDRDGRPSMPDGPVAINLFARIVGDPTAFYQMCYRMRREGVKRLRVERVE